MSERVPCSVPPVGRCRSVVGGISPIEGPVSVPRSVVSAAPFGPDSNNDGYADGYSQNGTYSQGPRPAGIRRLAVSAPALLVAPCLVRLPGH